MSCPLISIKPSGLAALTIAVAASGLAGCKPTSAAVSDPNKPTLDELRRAVGSAPAAVSGARQECLARLVFDVPGEAEWGVSEPGRWSGDKFRFSETMPGGHDLAMLAETSLVVLAPADWSNIEAMQRSAEARKSNGIREYEQANTVKRGRLADLQEVLADPSKNTGGDDLSGYPDGIASLKAQIADNEASIAGMKRDWQPTDWGLPQSLGYRAGSTLYAFILRDGRAYKFQSTGGEGAPPFAQREQAFKQMLRNFRPRKMYEIPKEPGICFPYGFVADDGTGHSRIEVSLRYKDRPGVIYTISSAVVGEQGVSGAEPAMVQATARASTGILAGAVAAGRTVKTLGPRQVKIGELPAWQGGVAMNTVSEGKAPIVNYSIYTGYGGWEHSRVLPNITINLRSFTKEQQPELPADPPPFEESLGRLDALIASMRLRPTQPPMPELASSVPGNR